MSLLIRNGTILTMNDAFEVIEGDVSIRDGRIAAVGQLRTTRPTIASSTPAGALVMPGLIQTHLHLCQTLFRGLADDLVLMDWLRTRVWPLEAAHTEASLRASARLAACELLLGGTTDRAHDGDRARHRRGLRGDRAERAARDHRQVPDGRRPRRAGAAARDDQGGHRRRAGAESRAGTARPTAACGSPLRRALRCRARASCSKRSARCRRATACSCTRTPPSRAARSTSCGRGPAWTTCRIWRRRAWPRRACAPRTVCGSTTHAQALHGRARRQGHALPGLEPQARLGPGAGRRAASTRASPSRWAPMARRATTGSTCSARCGWRRRFRPSGWDRAC